ncbi:vWA domain-containing protein [Pararhizobium mangrovi]|uniref:VWA domain-containing protein n=1 Tax=Pararhizobium mangrovi TaxID=2590452 RepID=A0A506UD07_9HYPH|nr:VWA domain-containing protein [Pararhizobium mangrovi]TPW29627.1 VWA domain-containing protein [Pararhizobium mangrovi]
MACRRRYERWLRLTRKFLRDNAGNFALVTALILPVTLGAAGVAVETGRMLMVREHAQAAADDATLAAAAAIANGAIDATDGEEYATDHFHAEMTGVALGSKITVTPNFKVETANTSGHKDVTARASVDIDYGLMGFLHLLGLDDVHLTVGSTSKSASETRSALSIYFVLDRSGSMSDYSNGTMKIMALKTAMTSFLDRLDEADQADPQTSYVRTGVIAYNTDLFIPRTRSDWNDEYSTCFSLKYFYGRRELKDCAYYYYLQNGWSWDTDLHWSSSPARSYVDAILPSGNTNSAVGMALAYQKLVNGDEDKEHEKRNGQKPKKIIVLMTDGENNVNGSDEQTTAYCNAAKAHDVEIFSVAFAAPEHAKALLRSCANDENHFYAAADSDQLVSAFQSIGKKATNLMVRLAD